MRILNENDIEIQESDVNTELGYLKQDKVFKKHIPAVEGQEEIYHYRLKTWFFTDGTSMEIKDENDPHVQVIDAKKGQFKYVDQGEGKTYHGGEVVRVVDHKAVEAVEEHDEYEDIQRYVLYTEKEIEDLREYKRKSEERESFMEEGPQRLNNVELTTDDIVLLLAEMIGE